MKKLFPLLTLFIYSSCSNPQPEKKTEEVVPVEKLDTLAIGNKIYLIKDLTDTNYTFSPVSRYAENDSLVLLNNKDVERHGDTLLFKCDKGKTVSLVNNLNEEEYTVYRFLELNKDINFYVVHCSYFEGSGIKLINRKSAKQIDAIGPPVVSPNKEFFACGNCDLIAQFDVSGIELYKKANSSHESIGLREISNWGPEEMMWKNDSTLIIRGLQIKNSGEEPVKVYKSLFVN